MGYFEEKAKRMYDLYTQNLPIHKVYAVVEKDGKFLVLTCKKGKYKYCLSGGSVDEGEDNVTAIKRELLEEMNIEVEVIRLLGALGYKTTWTHEGFTFDIKNEAEIFYTRFASFGDHDKLGLDGEFSKDTKIKLISKKKMLANVEEFVSFGVTLD